MDKSFLYTGALQTVGSDPPERAKGGNFPLREGAQESNAWQHRSDHDTVGIRDICPYWGAVFEGVSQSIGDACCPS